MKALTGIFLETAQQMHEEHYKRKIEFEHVIIDACAMMLDHVKREDLGDRLRQATNEVLNKDNVRTGNLGGSATTDQYAKALIARVKG